MLRLWWDEGWLRDVHTSTPKQSLEACVEPFPAEMCVTDSVIFFCCLITQLWIFIRTDVMLSLLKMSLLSENRLNKNGAILPLCHRRWLLDSFLSHYFTLLG